MISKTEAGISGMTTSSFFSIAEGMQMSYAELSALVENGVNMLRKKGGQEVP